MRALVVVDVQRDFIDGSLPVPHALLALPKINDLIAVAMMQRQPTFFTRCWHIDGHPSFKQWGRHCVQNTWGADPPGTLLMPDDAELIWKAQEVEALSGFDGTPLEDMLRTAGVDELDVCGFALEVCVRATVLDALRLGFKATLHLSACAGVDIDECRIALDEMRAAGASIRGALA